MYYDLELHDDYESDSDSGILFYGDDVDIEDMYHHDESSVHVGYIITIMSLCLAILML